MKARFGDTDAQLKAKDALSKALNPDPDDPSYIVALNLLSRSPHWLTALHALPMYLGLDLRGGVHFLMQVDMKSALTKKAESLTGDIRTLLRDKNMRHAGITRDGNTVDVRFRDRQTLRRGARRCCTDQLPDLQWAEGGDAGDLKLTGTLKAEAARAGAGDGDQAEHHHPAQPRQRARRGRAGDPAAGRRPRRGAAAGRAGHGQGQGHHRPHRDARGAHGRRQRRGGGRGRRAPARCPSAPSATSSAAAAPLIVKRQVILTGENLTDAQPGFDGQTQEPAVHLTLDAKGARIFKDVTRENVGKRMAILLFEKGKGEVVTAPVIRGEIGGGRVQISGRMTTTEANDTALLLRAGSLAAPMEIIEERTIGPSLGAENIAKGFDSVIYGFAAIAVFMCLYYLLFGVFSTLALAFNLLLLIAVLSMLQATLTLPGIAAIALTLGMAIDANVLINERVREELRAGASPQTAISHRLRARLRDDPRLEHHHADRRPRAARLRLRPGARLRRRALPGHHDVDVLGGDVLARAGQPLVRPQEEAQGRVDRAGVAADTRRART